MPKGNSRKKTATRSGARRRTGLTAVREASAEGWGPRRHTGEQRQVLVRLSGDEAKFLATLVPPRGRAKYLRRLLARDMARRERKALAAMFAAAAHDVTQGDRAERRALVGGFANGR